MARLTRSVPVRGFALGAGDGHETSQFAVVSYDLGIPHVAAALAGALHDLRVLGLCHVVKYSSGGNPQASYYTGYLDIHFSAIYRRV